MVRAFLLAALATGAAAMQQRASRPPAVTELASKRAGANQEYLMMSAAEQAAHAAEVNMLAKAGVKAQYPKMSAAEDLKTEMTCPPAQWKNPYKSGPWREAEGGTSLCSEGKVIPQVYLLGAMKASTSSMAFDLASRGVMPVGDDKEFNFFGKIFDNSQEAPAREKWLGLMPECPDKGQKQKILADYTPHMHYTPLPEKFRRLEPGGVANYSLPHVLTRFHSDSDKEKLVFVASLRKPLGRMQSAWYAGRMCKNQCICNWCRHENFVESLQVQLNEWKKPERGISDWLWASMYGHQLEAWLHYFSPDRLIVQLTGQYSKNGVVELCEAVSEKSGFRLVCDPQQEVPSEDSSGGSDDGVTHKWSSKHPDLEDDAPAHLLEEYEKLLADDGKRLARVLAKAHGQGATLVGYTGTVGDPADVLTWLKANW